MAVMPFGEWLPDQPALGNPGATVATNVVPGAASYRPMRALSAQSDAINGYCTGAISCTDKDGNVYTFAGSDKLQQLSGTAWLDRSKSAGTYTLASDENWEFQKFGETLIATTIAEPMQAITLGGSAFADLATSTLKPKARHIGVVGEFVMIGNVDEGTVYPERVRWSAIDNAADWDADVATQSDYQDLVGDGGWVQRIVGGRDYGVILQERAVWRATYVGSPVVFQIDQVETARGALLPRAVASIGRQVFYVADDGFFAFDGAQSVPIGDEKVNRFFFDDLDTSFKHRVTGAICPASRCWWISYPNADATAGLPNRVIVFNWPTNRWTYGEHTCEVLFRYLSAGYTLEGLDSVSASVDALEASLDSRQWTGGDLSLSAFDSAHKLAFFTGAVKTATLETAEAQLVAGQRAILSGVRPLVDGGDSTVTPITRNRLQDATSAGSASSQNAAGMCPIRSNARYHRFRATIANDFDHAQGIDVPQEMTAPGGMR